MKRPPRVHYSLQPSWVNPRSLCNRQRYSAKTVLVRDAAQVTCPKCVEELAVLTATALLPQCPMCTGQPWRCPACLEAS